MQLKINIVGQAAAGKTTLAIALVQFLKQNGFSNVSVSDFDTDNEVFMQEHPAEVHELQQCRFEAIKDRKIIITTISVRRSCLDS